MNQKILSEIKNIASEIENSSNISTSQLKEKISELYGKLVILEFLENSIVGIEEISADEKNTVQATESIVDALDFSKEENEEVEIITEIETIYEATEIIEEVKEETIKEVIPTSNTIEESDSLRSLNETIETKKSSLHKELKKNSIQIGLNDRIAFVKRLFDGNQQDFHRVLSQVNTFSTIDEVREFIDIMVKPEHNWEDQEEYADRFMEIIEVKFQ